MCGLVGMFDIRDGRQIDDRVLARMTATLTHRGPDGSGRFVGPGIGLGHRRLAIIDIAGGVQPLFNEDRSVCVVFNGEIFNFPDLVDELTAAGHRFRTRSDTEVIVHAWEEWGERCVLRFRGMFAFALWDSRTSTLFLARDRLGIKPLYYAQLSDGLLLFASELKGLLVHPEVPRRLDVHAVEEYFAYGYVPDPRTIYLGCHKLPPGHTLTVRRSGAAAGLAAPQQYWDASFHPHPAEAQEAAGELVERLREAVRIRLIADVPLGAFLSGGVDSSTVVALMAESTGEPVRTCAIGFEDAAFDETAHAAEVARRYGTDHQSYQVRSGDFDLLAGLAHHFDEPFADNSAMPTYQVCALARRRVKVALSGDGGDELFAGYRRYRLSVNEDRLRRLLPAGARRHVFGTLGRLYPKLDWAPQVLRGRTTFQALADDAVQGYFRAVSILTDDQRRRIFSPAMRRDLQGYTAVEVLARHMTAAPAEDLLSRIQYADLKTWLAGGILTKVDRMSMAHGLEVRTPLLDHRFVEWSARLPASLKLRSGQGKFILKQAMRTRLPASIIDRRKQGFSLPASRWFRGPLHERLRARLTTGALPDCGLFDMSFVTRALSEHRSGRTDHGACLWSLLNFALFLEQMGKVNVTHFPLMKVVDGGKPSTSNLHEVRSSYDA